MREVAAHSQHQTSAQAKETQKWRVSFGFIPQGYYRDQDCRSNSSSEKVRDAGEVEHKADEHQIDSSDTSLFTQSETPPTTIGTLKEEPVLNESAESLINLLSMINSMIESTKSRINLIDEFYKNAIIENNEETKTVEKSLEPVENPQQVPEDLSGDKLMHQIKAAIHLHFNPEREIELKNKRGRPEYKKDLTPIALKNLLNKWERELAVRLKRDQRSDALFASVGRYIKKIPDIFLKYIGSKCQFKSKDIRVVLKAYLKCFLKGFLVMFPKHENNYEDLFFDFILLWFPESKALDIFERLKKEKSISQEEFSIKKKQLEIRVKASKKSYKQLYRENRWFKIIWQNIPEHFTHLNGSDKKKVDNVLEYLVSPVFDDDSDDEKDQS